VIFDIDIRYRSSGSTISVTYDIEEQRYRSFSYDIEVLATISKNYDIEETSISKSETSISGCQGSRWLLQPAMNAEEFLSLRK
jgi:hypothetical protein